MQKPYSAIIDRPNHTEIIVVYRVNGRRASDDKLGKQFHSFLATNKTPFAL